jgi:bifunctional DNA-binding transcriptional regulator/antitoxin component of YhaV-PrlF toxin-antitoxin module
MKATTSTITSKWQVTIPEGVRRELPFRIGQRIAWEIEGDKLVGRRVRSIGELAGCLKSDESGAGVDPEQSALAKAAVARHERISRQKP